MRTKHTISFHEVYEPLREPVTKFGGQPVGFTMDRWPQSRSTGKLMRFICQIALQDVGMSTERRMAYVFMTEEEEFVDGTYEPHGGENAVIVLTPDLTQRSAGPTLFAMIPDGTGKRLVPKSCEFSVELTRGTDPDEMGTEAEHMSENKIGGTPAFMQGDDTPEGDWDFLLQLDSTSVPFFVNFGDAGISYAFISRDRKSGLFLWQCG